MIKTGEYRAPQASKDMQLEMEMYQDALNAHGDNLKELCNKYGHETHQAVAQKRTCITRNTYLYLELHLHASEKFVSELRHVMANYCELSFEMFEESVADIAATAQTCAAMAEFVRDLHTTLADDVEAALNMEDTLAKLDLERKNLEASKAMLDAKCEWQQTTQNICELLAIIVSAISIAAAPVTLGTSTGLSLFGLAPAAMLEYIGLQTAENLAETLAKVAEAQQQIVCAADAAKAITGPIRKCLQSLSDALTAATQFFSVINTEVQMYKDNADKAADAKQSPEAERLQSKLKRHYLLMKRPAQNLVELCHTFDAAIIKNKTMLTRLVDGVNGVERDLNKEFVKVWLTQNADRLQLDQEEGRSARLALLPPSYRRSQLAPPKTPVHHCTVRLKQALDNVEPSCSGRKLRAEVAEADAGGLGAGAAQAVAAAVAAAAYDEPAMREELDCFTLASHSPGDSMHACEQGRADTEYRAAGAAAAVAV